jgi:predicted O-methyltransferase YrrM
LSGLGIPTELAFDGFTKWSGPLSKALTDVTARSGHQGGISLEDGKVLYGTTRALRPQYVIETGVAAGISTSFISAALIENGAGSLWSIELPPAESASRTHSDGGVFAWPESGVGWAVPPEIRTQMNGRHTLILEDARTALPKLVRDLPKIDLFFHDDLHTPDHMLWEYRMVWPRLGANGVMLSDDANFGWVRFCSEHRPDLKARRGVNMQRLTAARKSDATVAR